MKELPRSRLPLGKTTVVIEYGLQQHLGAGRALLLRRVLGLVVADAVTAWDENHRSWRHTRNICCVMPRPGNNLPRGQTAECGGAAHGGDAIRVKAYRRLIP